MAAGKVGENSEAGRALVMAAEETASASQEEHREVAKVAATAVVRMVVEMAGAVTVQQ